MGTSTTAAEFSGKIRRWADNVAKLPVECEKRNQQTAKSVMGEAVASETGGDSALTRRGSITVVTQTVGEGMTKVSARGPLALVENPTVPHEIGADGQRLNIPGIGWRIGPVSHPGTRGKHQWRDAKDNKIKPPILADTQKAMTATGEGVF